MRVSDASITATITLKKKQNAEGMLLVALFVGSGGESTGQDMSFPSAFTELLPQLKLRFGRNFLSKYFSTVFFRPNIDLIS